MTKERPSSIIWFERLFFLSMAVSFFDMFYHRDMFAADGSDFSEFGPEFMMIAAVAILFGFGVQILLWFFIAHRASSIARSIYLVFSVLGLIGQVGFFAEYTDSEVIFMIIYQVIAVVSVVLLFRPDAKAWFKSKGSLAEGQDENLADIFK